MAPLPLTAGARKTATMIAAAAVITRAVFASPSATARLVWPTPVLWRLLLVVSLVYLLACRLFELVVLLTRGERSKELEILVLRHESRSRGSRRGGRSPAASRRPVCWQRSTMVPASRSLYAYLADVLTAKARGDPVPTLT